MTNEAGIPSTPPPPGGRPELRVLRGRARAFTLQIAAEARAEWAYTSDVIARSFRTHRELGSGERRLIAETVYGLVRWHRRLEAIVDEVVRGLPDPSPEVRDELLLVAYEARQGNNDPAATATELQRLLRVAGKAEGLAARLAGEEAGLGTTKGLDREALRRSFPTWLLERLVADLGEAEAFALADAFNRRAPLAIRVNSVRIEREQLMARLAKEGITARPTALSAAGLVLETRVNAFGLDVFREGMFEVMDEGSQLVAEVVAPPPRGRMRRRLRGRGRQDAGPGGPAGRAGAGAGPRRGGQEARGAAAAGPAGGAVERDGPRCRAQPGAAGRRPAGWLGPGAGGRPLLGAGDLAPQPRGPLAPQRARGG